MKELFLHACNSGKSVIILINVLLIWAVVILNHHKGVFDHVSQARFSIFIFLIIMRGDFLIYVWLIIMQLFVYYVLWGRTITAFMQTDALRSFVTFIPFLKNNQIITHLVSFSAHRCLIVISQTHQTFVPLHHRTDSLVFWKGFQCPESQLCSFLFYPLLAMLSFSALWHCLN